MSDDDWLKPPVEEPATPPETPPVIRNRTKEYDRRKRNRAQESKSRNRRRQDAQEAVLSQREENAEAEMHNQLRLLEQRTRNNPTDADGDIDFAYRNMALPTVTPSMAPSISGWSWYIYARNTPEKFLEICAKREDNKSKMAGTITNQRMSDDRRNQFAVIDRIEKELTLDVTAIIKELMEKFPEDVARECRKHTESWKAFFAEEHP